MKKIILALDMGGTAIKAQLYLGHKVEKKTRWEHDYRDCSLEKAKSDLTTKIKNFCSDNSYKIDAIGLGIAGLIGTDGSVYKSTVLTSFQGFNLPVFLKDKLNVEIVTIDNDADCGALSEYRRIGSNLFYVVVGSGIGSAYVNDNGELPYLTRFDPQHRFLDQDNPIPNDVGLQVGVPKTYIYEKLREYQLTKEAIDKVLVDENGNPLKGPNEEANSIRVGRLGSAAGIKNILEMFFASSSERKEEWYQQKIKNDPYYRSEKIKIQDFSDERKIAKALSVFADKEDGYARRAFEIFGHFLGYGIAEAQKIIRSEQNLIGFPPVHLNGPIMNSFEFFGGSLQKALGEKGIDCSLRLSDNFNYANVHGAYLNAAKALEQTK